VCADPTPDAIIRIQRLRDNGNTGATTAGSGCPYAGSTNAHDWWPNALYDTREGNYRPGTDPGGDMTLGGVMNYISLDVNNLRRWLAGSPAPRRAAMSQARLAAGISGMRLSRNG